jgi:hypothetical protein
MLLLIDIFSINKGRGYENPILEIIVTERCSTGGCPLKEAHEHCFLNQSAIYVVVLISFMCYCGDYVGFISGILQGYTMSSCLCIHIHIDGYYPFFPRYVSVLQDFEVQQILQLDWRLKTKKG